MKTDGEEYLIKGGRVIDPASGADGVMDVRISRGTIVELGAGLKQKGGEVIDAGGLVVCPGFVDIHVHLREPGEEGKETVWSGTRAAAMGGVTSVVCMPNTVPPLDSAAMITYVLAKASQDGVVRVLPLGCVSEGRKGEVLADLPALKEAGAAGFTDDGNCVMNSLLAKRAMINCASLGSLYVEHAEDENLLDGGVMHEGSVSLKLGLSGRSALAEEAIVGRDLLLADATGARLHVAHVSSAGSLKMIRDGKKRGTRVTCEVTPHHLLLTDEAIGLYDTRAKVNPPLRSEKDRLALIAAAKDGVIDAIATDHAPHGPLDKEVEFNVAAAGMVGLETLLPLTLEAIVRTGALPLAGLVKLLSAGPASVMGMPAGELKAGTAADVTIFDESAEWVLDAGKTASKSRNTPFDGKKLKGRVVHTLVGGRPVVREGSLV